LFTFCVKPAVPFQQDIESSLGPTAQDFPGYRVVAAQPSGRSWNIVSYAGKNSRAVLAQTPIWLSGSDSVSFLMNGAYGLCNVVKNAVVCGILNEKTKAITWPYKGVSVASDAIFIRAASVGADGQQLFIVTVHQDAMLFSSFTFSTGETKTVFSMVPRWLPSTSVFVPKVGGWAVMLRQFDYQAALFITSKGEITSNTTMPADFPHLECPAALDVIKGQTVLVQKTVAKVRIVWPTLSRLINVLVVPRGPVLNQTRPELGVSNDCRSLAIDTTRRIAALVTRAQSTFFLTVIGADSGTEIAEMSSTNPFEAVQIMDA